MDDLQQLLLARLTGQQDLAAVPSSLPDLVEQAMGDDPMAGTLVAALRNREAARAAAAEDDTGGGGQGTDDPFVADVMQRLYAELEDLRARNAMLADALGACPRCWGEDASCPVCRGRGVAGGRSPDPELFESVIRPAIRRRQADHVHGLDASTAHPN